MFEKIKKAFTLKVYLVGELGKENDGNITWGVVGLFLTKDRAIEACKTINHFYVLIPVDEKFEPEEDDWIFPLRNKCDCGENCNCGEEEL